jgi:hypothetical protein
MKKLAVIAFTLFAANAFGQTTTNGKAVPNAGMPLEKPTGVVNTTVVSTQKGTVANAGQSLQTPVPSNETTPQDAKKPAGMSTAPKPKKRFISLDNPSF